MSNKATETQPAPVTATSRQAGEIQARWAWTEPCIWSPRMLTALENGVKGGQWFSLIDKVYAQATLERAFEKVKSNRGKAGVDRQTIAMFERRKQDNLRSLATQLREGSYQPHDVLRKWIDKPGSKDKRPLGIPTVRDRVVQTALNMVIGPIFEKGFAEHSYGFRPGRGCKDALRQVEQLLDQGHQWVVDADLKSYFDTIPRQGLMKLVGEQISDGRVLALVELYLEQHVMEGLERWQPEAGSPQGAIISPLLSNIYLNPLDQLMEKQGRKMVRYADDFVILCRSREEAELVLAELGQWCDQAGLQLHPEKTQLVDANQEGFDFLGYHFERGRKWPRKKSMEKIKLSIRAKTRRTNGHSLARIIERLNPSLRGWYEYFKHGRIGWLREIDQMVRRRLRSILRKRRKLKGTSKGNGRDHQRWPNAYFVKHGLFTMTNARDLAAQSANTR